MVEEQTGIFLGADEMDGLAAGNALAEEVLQKDVRVGCALILLCSCQGKRHCQRRWQDKKVRTHDWVGNERTNEQDRANGQAAAEQHIERSYPRGHEQLAISHARSSTSGVLAFMPLLREARPATCDIPCSSTPLRAHACEVAIPVDF